ncbi:MAG: fumarate hydratase [Syntrophomonadaceae bacterium]|jgi:fumarate hydratase subunit alpha
MREINTNKVKEAVEEAVIKANTQLPQDILNALRGFRNQERSPLACRLLDITLENANLACSEGMALCQDTGLVVVDVELGQEVVLTGNDLESAINQGVREGYKRGYFRKSIVSDPLERVNTQDNTPAVIHLHMVPGDGLKLNIMPKGGGSENMGQVAMLKPSQGVEGVKNFIIKVVKEAGANPCPPVIVGVGVGGNMEKAALLAKKALMREVGTANPLPALAALEEELLTSINDLGIGPQGMGGDTTALAVHIETYPTHIACLPVAVNLGCHSTRRVTVEI